MELDFSTEHDELRDSLRTVLARECPPSLVREVVEARVAGDAVHADGLWAQMCELGWPALTVPEEHGGLGLGPVELAIVAEELGRVLAPGPLLATTSQLTPVLLELGGGEQRARYLPGVAQGAITGTLAIADAAGAVDPTRAPAEATALDGGSYRIDGEWHFVVEAEGATELVLVAQVAGGAPEAGVVACIVARDAVAVSPIGSLDPTTMLATVTADALHVPAERVLGSPGPDTTRALRRVVEVATVARAVCAVGTMQTVFDISLAYAKEREQFGVPIGSFQAMKHKFADMLVLLERARSLGYYAALTLAEDDDRRALAASMAKAAAGDAIARIAKEGVQIHGGIGYTWEHDMHLYVRRLRADALLFGGVHEHRARVADLLGV